MKTALLVAMLVTMAAPSAFAKAGRLWFKGRLEEVKVSDEELSYLVTGVIQLQILTNPTNASDNQEDILRWEVSRVPVHIPKWKGGKETFQAAVDKAMTLERNGAAGYGHIPNPLVGFNEAGKLDSIEGRGGGQVWGHGILLGWD